MVKINGEFWNVRVYITRSRRVNSCDFSQLKWSFYSNSDVAMQKVFSETGSVDFHENNQLLTFETILIITIIT